MYGCAATCHEVALLSHSCDHLGSLWPCAQDDDIYSTHRMHLRAAHRTNKRHTVQFTELHCSECCQSFNIMYNLLCTLPT